MLYKLRRAKILDFPIYIGGLSSKISDIYDRRAQMGRRQLPRLQLLDGLRPFVLNAETIHDARTRAGRGFRLSCGGMTPQTLPTIFPPPVPAPPPHSIFSLP